MKVLSYSFKDIPALRAYLDSTDIRANTADSSAILIQVFSSMTDRLLLGQITDVLLTAMPDAVIVGATSVGEILNGRLQVGTIVLSLSFFDTTRIKAISLHTLTGSEREAGLRLMRDIKSLGVVAGVLMLAVPLSMDVAALFEGMSEEDFCFPVFGGGAGVYDPNLESMIFHGRGQVHQGAIAVAFLGSALHIRTRAFLGWKPLSRELTITETDGRLLKRIDGERAYDVYNRYLDIPNDRTFFENALEFPILVQRSGDTVARVPFFADEDGCIGFLADIVPGEKFHIGYGDPDSILRHAAALRDELNAFEADSIFLYACVCRRFLLQNTVDLETESFNTLAPTTGYYTYGEFFSSGNRIHLLNSTIVVAAFREGDQKHDARPAPRPEREALPEPPDQDPFSNKHNRIIARLLHFIGVVTSDLEEANKALRQMSGIDTLTQIHNRFTLDQVLQEELSRSVRYGTVFSVIILDIDHFKEINDAYGHLTGDRVLMEMADMLNQHVRVGDTFGRWGGEEFLVILPQTAAASARLVAEKIRMLVERAVFPEVESLTCSLGVSSFRIGDDQHKLLFRADEALYEAKHNGRNCVGFEKPES